MQFLKNAIKTPIGVLKVVGLGVAFLAVGIFMTSLVLSSLSTFSRSAGISMPFALHDDYDNSFSYKDGGYGIESESPMWAGSSARPVNISAYGDATFSTRNATQAIEVMPPMPPYGASVGNTAEAFEVQDFFYSYTPTSSGVLCDAVYALKSDTRVIFESSNESDRGCDYRFKVEKEKAIEVKALLDSYTPEDVTESTYTIQEQVKDFTDAISTLTNKLEVIDETLSSALSSYNEIQSIATKANDPDSLAVIIDSKIQLIERLTNEKLMIEAEIDRLERAKTRELDRVEYTFFTVSVYERPLVDTEYLADAWRGSFEQFVNEISNSFQKATLGLLTMLAYGVVLCLYLFVLLVAAKYGWRFAKKFWKS